MTKKRRKPEPNTLIRDEPHCIVWTMDDIVSKSRRQSHKIPIAGIDTRLQAAHRAAEAAGLSAPLIVTVNGEPCGSTDIVRMGDVINVAPRVGDPGTLALSFAISVFTGFLSYALRPKLDDPDDSGTPDQERFTFGQVVSQAFAGDTIPVVFGRLPRFGGKEISRVPGEGPNGDQILRMLIDLGHGPIRSVGSIEEDITFANAGDVTGIFLNEQEVSQFEDVRVSVRMGTADQVAIPGFDDTEIPREVGVGGIVLTNTSGFDVTDENPKGEEVEYSSVDPVDALVLRVQFPRGLYTVNTAGQFDPARVELRYRTRPSDTGSGPGDWGPWQAWTIERAIQTQFVAAQRIDGLSAGGDPQRFDVQLERVSPDSDGAAAVSGTTWVTTTEVVYSNNRYPGQALLALELIAGEELQGVPDVSADVRGYADLAIWDGVSDPMNPQFVRGYSANPAWIAREILENTTWGAGALYRDWIADSGPDLVALAQAADARVPLADGTGDRPRFEFNAAMDTAVEVVEALRTVCAAARCRPIQIGRAWRFPIDDIKPFASETFTDATIAADENGDAQFRWSRTFTEKGINSPNRIVGQFPNSLAQARPDVVGWPALGDLWLATEQLNERRVQLVGITHPEQVLSELKYQLKTERFRTREITFQPTTELPACIPGDRIDIAMSLPGYGLASGHVRAGSSQARVLLDRDVTFEAGEEYTLRIIHLDSTVEVVPLGQPGATTIELETGIDLSELLARSPEEGSQYVVGRTGVDVKPFLVQSIRPTNSDELRWEITAIEYAEDVYDDAAELVSLPDYSDGSDPRKAPGPVTDLTCFEVTTGGSRHFRLTWSQLPRDREITAQFRVYRRRINQSAWVLVPSPVLGFHQAVLGEIDDVDAGFEFRVVAVSPTGAFLSPFNSQHPTCTGVFNLGREAPPPPAFAELVREMDNSYTLRWSAVEEADGYQVLAGGDPSSTFPNAGAEDCFVLARTAETELTGLELPPGESVQFWIRSSLDSGRLSVWTPAHLAAATAATGLVPAPTGEAIRDTKSFDLSSEGIYENCEWNAAESRLEMINPAADAVWTSPEVDLGSSTDTELTYLLNTSNDADDPRFIDDVFRMPSIEADQWGLRLESPSSVGMLTPPFPDEQQSWSVEVRTHDGSSWSAWSPMLPFSSTSRLVERYQYRVTMVRGSFPYRPALRGLTGVATA